MINDVNETFDPNKFDVMITTIDNPFDPFDQFQQWYAYDEAILGHHTYSQIARFTSSSLEMSVYDEAIDLNNAIDRLILNDPLNVYRKLIRPKENKSEQ